jgi:hypothetical protein
MSLPRFKIIKTPSGPKEIERPPETYHCNERGCRHDWDEPQLFEECGHWHASECAVIACDRKRSDETECPACGHRWDPNNPEEDE